MPSGDLETWDGGVGGRYKAEGIYVYIWLTHFIVFVVVVVCFLRKIPEM